MASPDNSEICNVHSDISVRLADRKHNRLQSEVNIWRVIHVSLGNPDNNLESFCIIKYMATSVLWF
jgi:hypothetical protein